MPLACPWWRAWTLLAVTACQAAGGPGRASHCRPLPGASWTAVPRPGHDAGCASGPGGDRRLRGRSASVLGGPELGRAALLVSGAGDVPSRHPGGCGRAAGKPLGDGSPSSAPRLRSPTASRCHVWEPTHLVSHGHSGSPAPPRSSLEVSEEIGNGPMGRSGDARSFLLTKRVRFVGISVSWLHFVVRCDARRNA